MRQRSATRARGFLSRGALLSVLVHVNLLLPLGIAAWVYGGREEAQRAEEVDVAFQDATAEDLPKDLPPLEPPTDEQERDNGRRDLDVAVRPAGQHPEDAPAVRDQ